MNLNFSTSLYLGMQHSSREFPGWDSFTTGVPAAFHETNTAFVLGKSIARLQGLADGVVAPSTLHLFWDWFGGLNSNYLVLADSKIYQIGEWGMDRAMAKGATGVKFRHQCADSLQSALRRSLRPGQKPVVIADGWCPFCGRASPLHEYLKIIEPFGGLLVVDDTQALGMLGQRSSQGIPYGYGGGGSVKFLNIKNEHIIVISSLAKAFGVPIATCCGSVEQVQKFRLRSEIRTHSSPPSVPALIAGKNALQINAYCGDHRRQKLFENVLFFKNLMASKGIETKGGFFPVQTIGSPDLTTMRLLHHALLEKGIRTVPVLAHNETPALCWLLTSTHKKQDIERVCQAFFAVSHAYTF